MLINKLFVILFSSLFLFGCAKIYAKKSENVKSYPIVEIKSCIMEELFYGNVDFTNPKTRSSLQQLKDGGVAILIPALWPEEEYEKTEKSVKSYKSDDLLKQSEIFRNLPVKYPDDFYIITTLDQIENLKTDKIGLIGAIENVGGLFNKEDKTFDDSIGLFEQIIANTGRLFYVSLTWKHETMLGGGDETEIGLKDWGKKFLQYLSDRNKKEKYDIALDFSHSSDKLVKDAIAYIDDNNLNIQIMASHSSFRAFNDIQRNIPDWLVEEIIKRGGLLGLNFINLYASKAPKSSDELLEHANHMYADLGGEKHFAFGADWFMDERYSNLYDKLGVDAFFYQRYGNASKYHVFLEDMKSKYGLNNDQLKDLAYKNFVAFAERIWEK